MEKLSSALTPYMAVVNNSDFLVETHTTHSQLTKLRWLHTLSLLRTERGH